MKNREFKFRIWENNEKRWIDSFEDSLYISGKHGIVHISTVGEPFKRTVNPYTIQQYIGLKDLTGNEVFEGDIVKFYPWNSPKKEYEEYLCKSLKQIRWGLDITSQYPSVGFVAINLCPSDLEDGYQLNWMDARNMEVIGNIFENPELLK